MVINGDNIREIHKRLYQMTLKMPRMYLFMEKVANRASKIIDKRKTQDQNAVLLFYLFNREKYNSKSKKLINHELMEKAEEQKNDVIKAYIKFSESTDRWFYLASSHNDCAEDHKAYQGKMYYDDKAPDDIVRYAKLHGYRSIQWVMDNPVWFITRPNCRHFFKSLPLEVVKKYSVKELRRRYKTHRMDGDKSLATPRKIAIEEYEDRLNMLEGMYAQHKTEHLRREILKIKLLIKKWKNTL